MDAVIAILVNTLSSKVVGAIPATLSAVWTKFRTHLSGKLGPDHIVTEILDEMEEKPDDEGNQESLKEELANIDIQSDPQLVALLNEMMEELKKMPGGYAGPSVTQTVTGNSNIFSGTGDISIEGGIN